MTTIRLALSGSSSEAKHLQNPKYQPGLLISYFYYKKTSFDIQKDIQYSDWVMDSGAFSAYNSGAVIDIDEYIAVCKELKKTDKKLTEIFALDVIGDPKASLKNCEKMWSEGVEAIPCFHMTEPFPALIHIAKNYPKIAIGGVAHIKGQRKIDWARHCLKMIWPAKVHGFGFGGDTGVLSVPFHSVDATSWSTRPQRFGQWQSLKINASTSHPIRKDHKLELEVGYYMRLQERAKHRWKKEMAVLDSL